MNPLIPLGSLALGLILFIWGLIKRGTASTYRSVPCRSMNGLPVGEQSFITGKATSPVHTVAPVSGDSCVYYQEFVDREQRDFQNNNDAGDLLPANELFGNTHKSRILEKSYGGFFVNDGTGTALVVPRVGVLDLNKPDTVKDDTFTDSTGSSTRTEKLIKEGESVTVLGTPRSLDDFMRYMRGNSGLDMPAPFVEQLLKLENGEAGVGMPCFFGEGIERVSDVSHEDYIAGTANAAYTIMKVGAALMAAGVIYFYFLLKKAAPDASGL